METRGFQYLLLEQLLQCALQARVRNEQELKAFVTWQFLVCGNFTNFPTARVRETYKWPFYVYA